MSTLNVSDQVNRTIAQVVSLAQNCIVLCQVDRPTEHLPLPHFKELITISGASYHIVRRQFSVMPGYAVTVHDCEEGCSAVKQELL